MIGPQGHRRPRAQMSWCFHCTNHYTGILIETIHILSVRPILRGLSDQTPVFSTNMQLATRTCAHELYSRLFQHAPDFSPPTLILHSDTIVSVISRLLLCSLVSLIPVRFSSHTLHRVDSLADPAELASIYSGRL